MHVQFATSADLPHLTEDDLLAARALEARGASVEPVVWTEPRHPEVVPDAVVIRSCWDYHLRPAGFRAWLDDLERAGTTIMNSPALVRWNLHKSYLPLLSEAGVPTVPTVLSATGDQRTLADILDAAGWTEAVVKPAVSLSAYQTWQLPRPDAAAQQERFARLRSTGDVLVQKYVREVTSSGEWSLIFFGTEFSHAVRKHPKPGDFRVQTEHGGSVAAETPPGQLIDDAARAIAALPELPVYSRVDGVVTDDTFAIMEVECIDPVLFFELHPAAAAAFAEAVWRRLGMG